MNRINRTWAMPNKNTFTIKPINQLIQKYLGENWIDPFANDSVFNKKCKMTNDLNPKFTTDCHEEALDFLKRFKDNEIDGVLLDPPYSPRQLKECYDSIGRSLTREDTQASFWSKIKDEITRILKPNGIVISCGWNTNGIGKKRGFKILEILLVAHGGNHNDTICMVERKNGQQQIPFL